MERFKILGQANPVLATPTVLYTVPLPAVAAAETAQTVVLMLSCCNINVAESSFSVWLLPDTLAAPANVNKIYNQVPLSVNETLLLAQNIVIPGDIGDGKSAGIVVQTITGDVSYTLVGVEITR